MARALLKEAVFHTNGIKIHLYQNDIEKKNLTLKGPRGVFLKKTLQICHF
jgi:hypothetical protein